MRQMTNAMVPTEGARREIRTTTTTTTTTPLIMTRRAAIGTLLGAVTVMMACNTACVTTSFQYQTPYLSVRSFPRSLQHVRSESTTTQQQHHYKSPAGTMLFMGKLHNRQAELQKKMALAKKQNANNNKNNDNENGQQSSSSSSSFTTMGDSSRLSPQEIKEQNDRKRFEELLKGSQVFTGEDNYLNDQQEEESIDAYRRGVDRLFEGDPAPTAPFEELVSIKSENAIGETGAKRLVPWLRHSGSDDYLVIISDPRVKSPEFREAIQALRSELPQDIASKIVFVNADTPAENRRFLKKNNFMDSGIKLYSDEKREWMQAYTALGENRWSMTMFIISQERIQKLVREMASVDAASVVSKAVKAMEKRRL